MIIVPNLNYNFYLLFFELPRFLRMTIVDVIVYNSYFAGRLLMTSV